MRLPVRRSQLVLSGTRLLRRQGSAADTVALVVRIEWWRVAVLHGVQAPAEIGRWRCMTRRARRRSPLWTWRPRDVGSLVLLGVDILRHGSRVLRRHARPLVVPQQLQPGLDVLIARVEVGCALVRIQGVVGLIVARLVLRTMSAPTTGRTQGLGSGASQVSPGRTTLPKCRDSGGWHASRRRARPGIG